MKDAFSDLIDYDEWANRLWIGALEAFDPELIGPAAKRAMFGPWQAASERDPAARASQVMVHVLWASRTWVSRCGCGFDEDDCSAWIWQGRLSEAWREAISRHSPESEIRYSNTRGEAYSNTFGHIFHHAMNHGTYHRGQLREIAEALRIDPPDTDYIGYLRLRK